MLPDRKQRQCASLALQDGEDEEDGEDGDLMLLCARCPVPAGKRAREVLLCGEMTLKALARFARACQGRVQPPPAPTLCQVKGACAGRSAQASRYDEEFDAQQ